MNADYVDGLVAAAVSNVLEAGAQPGRVLLGMPAYKVLLARDGLATRSIKSGAAASVRALVHGFDLPVDCERSVADDNALCTFIPVHLGLA